MIVEVLNIRAASEKSSANFKTADGMYQTSF